MKLLTGIKDTFKTADEKDVMESQIDLRAFGDIISKLFIFENNQATHFINMVMKNAPVLVEGLDALLVLQKAASVVIINLAILLDLY